MKLSFPKNIRIDGKQLINATKELRRAFGGGRKTGAMIISLPVLGWATSEVHHYADNRKQNEKDRLYQQVIRKHQAEIDMLKSDKEREEYKQRLWAKMNQRTAEVYYGHI